MSTKFYLNQIKTELKGNKEFKKNLKKLSKCADKNGRHWASINRIKKLGLENYPLEESKLIKKRDESKRHYIVYYKKINCLLWKPSKRRWELVKKIGIIIGIITLVFILL